MEKIILGDNTTDEILKLENELIDAMIESNVQVLDKLISDNLIFAAHTGQIFTKKDDIDAHQSGNIQIESIEPSDRIIKVHDNTVIVYVLLKIKGEFFGQSTEGTFRFSRVWIKVGSSWKIVAGQSTLLK